MDQNPNSSNHLNYSPRSESSCSDNNRHIDNSPLSFLEAFLLTQLQQHLHEADSATILDIMTGASGNLMPLPEMPEEIKLELSLPILLVSSAERHKHNEIWANIHMEIAMNPAPSTSNHRTSPAKNPESGNEKNSLQENGNRESG